MSYFSPETEVTFKCGYLVSRESKIRYIWPNYLRCLRFSHGITAWSFSVQRLTSKHIPALMNYRTENFMAFLVPMTFVALTALVRLIGTEPLGTYIPQYWCYNCGTSMFEHLRSEDGLATVTQLPSFLPSVRPIVPIQLCFKSMYGAKWKLTMPFAKLHTTFCKSSRK